MKNHNLGNVPPKGLKYVKRIARRFFKRIKADKVLLKELFTTSWSIKLSTESQ